jgi:hypothetical protein
MKRFVVAQIEPLRMFLINSERTDFAEAQPAYIAATPIIYLSDNPSVLTHNSHVGCDHLSHEYSYDQVDRKITNDPSILMGRLDQRSMVVIRDALAGNYLIPRKYLRELIPEWDQAIAAAAAATSPPGGPIT